MIQLTEEQQRQLREAGGNPVRLSDSETNQTYVILPETVYERLKALVYDDSPLTDEEKRQQLADSGKRAGWDDSEMDVYDDYDENLKKLWPSAEAM